MHKDVFRLAALLGAFALATSRIGLIGHELVGHGGLALACGANITNVELFWFAGGWIRYWLADGSPAAAIAIAMGGIAVELVAGVTLAAWVRGPSLGRRLVRATGLVLIVHATWYLATGAFHGFGDGEVLFRALGDWRVLVAVPAGIVTCIAAYAAARSVFGVLVATLPGSRRARIAGVIVAMTMAGGVHAGLAAAELAIRRDATYTAVMQSERDRRIAFELAKWQREHRDRPGDDARAERRRLERVHRSFPFVWLLAAATAVCLCAGAWRPRAVPDQRISTRLLAVAWLIATVAITSVIVIGSYST
jgi:hypothetical protein